MPFNEKPRCLSRWNFGKFFLHEFWIIICTAEASLYTAITSLPSPKNSISSIELSKKIPSILTKEIESMANSSIGSVTSNCTSIPFSCVEINLDTRRLLTSLTRMFPIASNLNLFWSMHFDAFFILLK